MSLSSPSSSNKCKQIIHLQTEENHSSAPNDVRLSKRISYILRHGARKLNIPIQDDAYLPLEVLLKYLPATVKDHDIKRIVANDAKQRYSLSEFNNKFYIRANQGHSIHVPNLELKKIQCIEDFLTIDNRLPVLIHSTYYSAWPSILKKGLSVMRRNHIHFSTVEPGSDLCVPAPRRSAQILIYLNIEKMLEDRIELFLSENKVVLSPGINGIIDTRYFKMAIDTKLKKVIEFSPQATK